MYMLQTARLQTYCKFTTLSLQVMWASLFLNSYSEPVQVLQRQALRLSGSSKNLALPHLNNSKDFPFHSFRLVSVLVKYKQCVNLAQATRIIFTNVWCRSFVECCLFLQVFLIIRGSKDRQGNYVSPQNRFDKMLQSPEMQYLAGQTENVLSRIHVVEGDLQGKNLGISDEDRDIMIRHELSIDQTKKLKAKGVRPGQNTSNFKFFFSLLCFYKPMPHRQRKTRNLQPIPCLPCILCTTWAELYLIYQ